MNRKTMFWMEWSCMWIKNLTFEWSLTKTKLTYAWIQHFNQSKHDHVMSYEPNGPSYMGETIINSPMNHNEPKTNNGPKVNAHELKDQRPRNLKVPCTYHQSTKKYQIKCICMDVWIESWTRLKSKHMGIWARWMNLMHQERLMVDDAWQDGQQPPLYELGSQ